MKPQPRLDSSQLAQIWRQVFGQAVEAVRADPLQGDASTRRYFRLIPDNPDPGGPATLMLMQLEHPASEDQTDFTRTLEFLNAVNVPVPKFYHHAVEHGLLFLQDCGDRTLEEVLETSDLEGKRTWYGKAIDLLAHMQIEATRNVTAECPAYHLRFDVEKLNWELEFMREHFIHGLLGQPEGAPWVPKLQEQFLALSTFLEQQEPVFSHRDYHCRNLMVQDDDLVVLDFQDARMGPCQYDLVSLLRDSYMPIPEILVEEMVDRFISIKDNGTGRDIDRNEFRRVFDWMAVQRNLKAIGTFAYQTIVRKNPRYRKHIAPTLEYVRSTLERREDLQSLKEVLDLAIPDYPTGTS